MSDLPETREVIEKHLKLGASGIGEQESPVECDSLPMQLVYSIGRELDVPVLPHLTIDTGIERCHTMLEKFPDVNFTGHAQTGGTTWTQVTTRLGCALGRPSLRATSLTGRFLITVTSAATSQQGRV